MNIFPAIDLIGGEAVRLLKGDYSKKTVYNSNPTEVALQFEAEGAKHIHLVDLDGAKSGNTDNIEIVRAIRKATSLFIEIGGGIRNIQTVKTYIDAGVDRVILGTAAVKNPEFLAEALRLYGDKIAVGVDIKDGFVAIKGWLENSEYKGIDFCKKMQQMGVKTLIVTDISKDGAMNGTNLSLYKTLSEELSIDITASGGVSNIEDVKRLREMNLYGAIIGKAYYIGAIDLSEALEVAK